MSFAQYRGVLISLISKSDIRYEGVLENIDPQSSSIALTNVRSFGTEGRKSSPAEEVSPSDNVYNYICFRASDVKDLVVQNETSQSKQPFHDPAIMSFDKPGAQEQQRPRPATYPQTTHPAQHLGQTPPAFSPAAGASNPPGPAHPRAQTQTWANATQQPSRKDSGADNGKTTSRSHSPVKSDNSHPVSSTPQVNSSSGQRRDDGDQSPPNHRHPSSHPRGRGARGRGSQGSIRYDQNPRTTIAIPKEEFDFESSNAKFHKEDLIEEFKKMQMKATNNNDQKANEVVIPPSADKAYDKKTSFFDNISSDIKERVEQAEKGLDYQARRARMSVERDLNVATFGASNVDQSQYRGRNGRGGYRGTGGFNRGSGDFSRGRGNNEYGRGRGGNTGYSRGRGGSNDHSRGRGNGFDYSRGGRSSGDQNEYIPRGGYRSDQPSNDIPLQT